MGSNHQGRTIASIPIESFRLSGSSILIQRTIRLNRKDRSPKVKGFTQTTFFVHPKNSRFQCSASRFTEYFVHRKKTQGSAHPKKIPCLTAKCPSGKVNPM